MQKIVVLGAGMVGKAIASDLCYDYDVTAVDINEAALQSLESNFPLKIQSVDLSDSAKVKTIVKDFDLVIGAVPGFMGFQTLETVISAGKNIVDISFFDDDPFKLDDLAKKKNVIAVMDCGVAPGMSNVLLGYHDARMQVDNFECYVGGLPVVRSLPFQYKAPFSPVDVIEEYIRPARFVENGNLVIRPALSEPELMEFRNIGTLEAFNTDGLRTLLSTMKHIPNMKEKTLRYPGHIELMRVFRETGFFDEAPVEINGTSIRPIDFTTKLLFPQWKLHKDDYEFTVMKIIISGKEDGKDARYEYHLFDRFDPRTETSSMARTTGYPCTAVARLILEKQFAKTGINPPEFIGADENCFNKILAYQMNRNIYYRLS
ncbi:saccharopine dehydrogenase [candidate division KSB1 bacterium]|nr:saccharopine dehydrogenase [candidate division KSB1 bacterium]